jgi:hypothetical protein
MQDAKTLLEFFGPAISQMVAETVKSTLTAVQGQVQPEQPGNRQEAVIAAMVAKRMIRDDQPWLESIAEDLKAVLDHADRVKANLEHEAKTFLVKLLKNHQFDAHTGMQLLYKYFDPDGRDFWDCVCETAADMETRYKLHNMRMWKAASEDETLCPSVQRFAAAVPAMSLPLNQWH